MDSPLKNIICCNIGPYIDTWRCEQEKFTGFNKNISPTIIISELKAKKKWSEGFWSNDSNDTLLFGNEGWT